MKGWNDPWWDIPMTRQEQRMGMYIFCAVIVATALICFAAEQFL